MKVNTQGVLIMNSNVGSADRLIRLIVGALLISWPWIGRGMAFGMGGLLHWIAIVIGAILIVTALLGTCPLYRLVGVNTCKLK
jgi:hypothetical protein